jgi:hypothetical protein
MRTDWSNTYAFNPRAMTPSNRGRASGIYLEEDSEDKEMRRHDEPRAALIRKPLISVEL